MATTRTWVAIGALLIAAHPASAAEEPPLTIQGAVELALDRNPDVLKAREALRAAESNISLALSKALPAVNGTIQANRQKAATYSTSSPLFGGEAYNQYSAGLNLNLPLYDAAIWPGYKYNKLDLAIKKYEVALSERTLTESVVEAFYSVLLNQRLLEILRNTLKVDNETLAIAQRYLKIGRAQKIDVLQLQTQAALLSPKIAQADSQMRTAAAQLATLLRDLDHQSIRVRGALASPDQKWVQASLQQRDPELPEMLVARETVNQFEYGRDVQMAPYWPKLALVGNWQRNAYTKRELVDSNTTSWSMSLQLTVPIFAGLGSFAQRSSLVSQEKQLELEETKTSDTVSVNQIQTEKDLAVAQAQLDSSRQAAVYGRESLREAQRAYRYQTINYLQYQSSQQAYLDSESGYYQAKYNYIVALAKYFNAMGVPSPLLVAKLEQLGRETE